MTRTHRIVGVGRLTITPDRHGARDSARVEVTRDLAAQWDHDILNRAPIMRDVMCGVERFRRDSNFYAVDLSYRGRVFFRVWP